MPCYPKAIYRENANGVLERVPYGEQLPCVGGRTSNTSGRRASGGQTAQPSRPSLAGQTNTVPLGRTHSSRANTRSTTHVPETGRMHPAGGVSTAERRTSSGSNQAAPHGPNHFQSDQQDTAVQQVAGSNEAGPSHRQEDIIMNEDSTVFIEPVEAPMVEERLTSNDEGSSDEAPNGHATIATASRQKQRKPRKQSARHRSYDSLNEQSRKRRDDLINHINNYWPSARSFWPDGLAPMSKTGAELQRQDISTELLEATSRLALVTRNNHVLAHKMLTKAVVERRKREYAEYKIIKEDVEEAKKKCERKGVGLQPVSPSTVERRLPTCRVAGMQPGSPSTVEHQPRAEGDFGLRLQPGQSVTISYVACGACN